MTRAIAGIDRLRFERGGFDAWMYGIARHVVLDTQRALWREGPGLVPDAANADLDSEPSERAIATEESAQIREAFGRLGRSDQEILELGSSRGCRRRRWRSCWGVSPGRFGWRRSARVVAAAGLTCLLNAARGISD